MERKLIYSSQENHPWYGAGSGDTERYEYECPCGKGKIIEEHDNIPGFRDLYISCDECKEKYTIRTEHGIRSWELIEK
jgi:predicted SprT family Zn-dependent metalloprotease